MDTNVGYCLTFLFNNCLYLSELNYKMVFYLLTFKRFLMKNYTLQDLLDIAQNLPKESYWEESLQESLGFTWYLNITNNRLTYINVSPHICTDTWVGIEFIYLDNEFVAVSDREYRKSDFLYTFKDKESKDKLVTYFQSFIEEDLKYKYLSDKDLSKSMGVGYRVPYAYTNIGSKAFYFLDNNPVEVTVVKGEQFDLSRRYKNFDNVSILLPTGNEIVVKVNTLLFPYFP